MVSAEREPIMGSVPPQWGPGAKPFVRGSDDILLIQTPYFAFNSIDESVILSN